MFTVDSQILRLAETSIDPVWRNQSHHAVAVDPVAADEFFASYLDESAEDEPTDTIRLVPGHRNRTETGKPKNGDSDDILRRATPVGDIAPPR